MYEWSGTNWSARPGGAPPRSDLGLAYDVARAQLVVFGGMDRTESRLGDTWLVGTQSTAEMLFAPKPRVDAALAALTRRGLRSCYSAA